MSREQRVGERGEQKRRWDESNRPSCACGQIMSRGAARCARCVKVAEHRHRNARRYRISSLWLRGLSARAIAEQLDSTEGSIHVEVQRMRAEGWLVPKRRQ